MSTLRDTASGLTRAWTAAYTQGLPEEAKFGRRAEIDSDLWDQRRNAEYQGEPSLSTATEILVRWLFGIPSDITWRIEAGASSAKGITPMNETLPMRIGFLLAMLPLVVLAVIGISFLVGYGDWDNTWEHWTWRGFFVALPIIGGIGLWLCATRPRLGMILVLVGVGAAAFLMPWMAFVTVPVGIAIIVIAYLRAGRPGWPGRMGRGLPTGTA